MQQIVCDRCGKAVDETNTIEMKATNYTPAEGSFGNIWMNKSTRNIDLCAECRDKFYLWLSGDCDENTTETK